VRRAVALLLAVAAANGWSIAMPAPVSAQCAFVVVRHDRVYFLYGSRRGSDIRPGAVLADTVEPGCSDVVGVPAPAPTHVEARRIPGVSPDVALLVRGEALVAIGYLPWSRGFPVGGPAVDETKGCRLGTTVSLSGTARVWPAGIEVGSGDRPTLVLVDMHTVVAGLTRRDLPRIGDRQRVRIQAVHCGRKLVARRIVAAGPIVRETSADVFLGSNWRGGASEPPVNHRAWWAAGAAGVVAGLAGLVLILRRRPSAPPRS
jgi:hypothetical protein